MPVSNSPSKIEAASVFGAGFLRVTDEPIQVFYEPFDAAPDTTNSWTPANAGGGTAPAVTSGVLTVGSGTTTAGYSSVTSIPTFRPTVPAWLGYSFALSMSDLAAPTAQTYRFWGAGTAPASPTVAAPLTNAIGFEVGIDGKMYAVVYAGGTRTAIADLSAATGTGKQPTDANSHRYGFYYRTDRTYFFIDSLENVVATASFVSPQIQTLPVKILAVAGTTPASSGILSFTGLAVWDTGKNATQISDGAYPWRKATVSATGAVSVRQSATAGTPVANTVGIAAAAVLAANAARVGLLMVNSGTTTIYLRYDGVAPTTALYSWRLDPGDRYDLLVGCPTGQIQAIGSAASGTLLVTELV